MRIELFTYVLALNELALLLHGFCKNVMNVIMLWDTRDALAPVCVDTDEIGLD